jgi:hypothetical protein
MAAKIELLDWRFRYFEKISDKSLSSQPDYIILKYNVRKIICLLAVEIRCQIFGRVFEIDYGKQK